MHQDNEALLKEIHKAAASGLGAGSREYELIEL